VKILRKKDLDERKKKVLQAIVEEYINTAEPVSSGSITKGHGLDYSSATIRNDMAQLESIGFLDKPHTSAGRVPSAEGYRYYVNELLKEDNLTLEEIKYIQNKLKIKVNEIEDLTKVATTTLSEITHYTTVAVGPKADKQIIEEIKFVSLGQRMLMVVIVTDTGLVKETIIKFDEDITESQVDTLNNLFNTRLRGKPLSKIDKPMAEYIFSEVHYSIGIMKAIIEQINRIVEEENNNIFLEGAKKSFDLPEFKSMKVAKNFVNLLDAKDEMVEIFNSGDAEDINVFIGDDDENSNLKDFSIITFKHTIGDKDLGTIGIIGPKRMDYAKVISVMKYISKKLKEDNEKKEGM
jgi:heat-inducible transcriptional repressor